MQAVRKTPIPHLVWEAGKWSVRANKKAPMVPIRYKLASDGYTAAGHSIPRRVMGGHRDIPVESVTSALADTGCTTMVAGLNFIRNLSLWEEELLPVRTEIKAANKTEIRVIGAVIVELQLNTPSSHLIS